MAITRIRQRQINPDWQKVNETLTYSSQTGDRGVVTVASGATTRFKVGQRIRFTQTTEKFGYIDAVTSTTLSIFSGSDYTLANAAITNVSISDLEKPYDFPAGFNLNTPTTGATGSMSFGSVSWTYKYLHMDTSGFCDVNFNVAGTTSGSASSGITINLPIDSATTGSTTDVPITGRINMPSDAYGLMGYIDTSTTPDRIVCQPAKGSNWEIGSATIRAYLRYRIIA